MQQVEVEEVVLVLDGGEMGRARQPRDLARRREVADGNGGGERQILAHAQVRRLRGQTLGYLLQEIAPRLCGAREVADKAVDVRVGQKPADAENAPTPGGGEKRFRVIAPREDRDRLVEPTEVVVLREVEGGEHLTQL